VTVTLPFVAGLTAVVVNGSQPLVELIKIASGYTISVEPSSLLYVAFLLPFIWTALPASISEFLIYALGTYGLPSTVKYNLFSMLTLFALPRLTLVSTICSGMNLFMSKGLTPFTSTLYFISFSMFSPSQHQKHPNDLNHAMPYHTLPSHALPHYARPRLTSPRRAKPNQALPLLATPYLAAPSIASPSQTLKHNPCLINLSPYQIL